MCFRLAELRECGVGESHHTGVAGEGCSTERQFTRCVSNGSGWVPITVWSCAKERNPRASRGGAQYMSQETPTPCARTSGTDSEIWLLVLGDISDIQAQGRVWN